MRTPILPIAIVALGLAACGAPGSNSSAANASGGARPVDHFGDFKLGTPRSAVRGTPVNLQEVLVEKASFEEIKLNDVKLRFVDDRVVSIVTAPRDITTCPVILERLVAEWGKPTRTNKADGIVSEWETPAGHAKHIDQPQKSVCAIELSAPGAR